MTRTIKSFTDSAHYFLTIDDESGQATECKCPDCQIRHRQCKHMREFNREVERAVIFNRLWQQFDVRSQSVRDARRAFYCEMFDPHGLYL